MTDKPNLTVIQGSATDDDPHIKAAAIRKKRPSAASILHCHRCGGNVVLEVKVGMIYKDGKAQGGSKKIICATCLVKGQTVFLA